MIYRNIKDLKNSEHLINLIVQVTQQPRQFSPPIQATDFPTKLLRLEFECSSLSYYTEIDAVCLLGTLDPISPSARATALLPPPSQQRWVVACCVVECC